MALYTVTVTTAGSDGSATGTGVTEAPVRGYLEAIKLDYSGTQAATTDVTITEGRGLSRTLATVSDTATDVTIYPAAQETGVAASGTSTYRRFYIDDTPLEVAVAQADDAETVTVIFSISEVV